MKKLILSMFMLFLTFLAFSESRTYYGYRYSFSTYDDQPDLTFVYKTTCRSKLKETEEYVIMCEGSISKFKIKRLMNKLKNTSYYEFDNLKKKAFDVANSHYKHEGDKTIYYIYEKDF